MRRLIDSRLKGFMALFIIFYTVLLHVSLMRDFKTHSVPAPFPSSTITTIVHHPLPITTSVHHPISIPITPPDHNPDRVFDIVYIVDRRPEASFSSSPSRINYPQLEALFQMTVKNSVPLSKHNHRVHLLSNDNTTIVLLSSLYPSLLVHDYSKTTLSARSTSFNKKYVHQSTNGAEMEKFCNVRWLYLADYFKGLNEMRGKRIEEGLLETIEAPYKYILGIDSDLALLQPPERLVSEWKLAHWAEADKDGKVNAELFEAHQVVSGAAMLWSLPGLEKFAAFMSKVYETKEGARRSVMQWGFIFPTCRPKQSVLIPCEKDGLTGMWHMSDMDVLRAWYLDDEGASIRTRNEDYQDCLVVKQTKKVPGLQLRMSERKREDGGKQMTMMGGMVGHTPTITNSTKAGGEEEGGGGEQQVCLVHFQGPKGKQLILPFYEFSQQGGKGVGTSNVTSKFVFP